jgi:FMN phosphatase YigB (HAD superfamily)
MGTCSTRSKLARSGLAPLFHHIEIVTEKDEDTYRRLLNRYGVLPEGSRWWATPCAQTCCP